MGVRHYRELFAWQTAVALNSQVVRLVMGSPEARKDLRYRSQILEAGRGVPSSIVEGFLRCNPGDFRRFLDYSISSIGEAEQRLRDGIELGYFSAKDCAEAFRLARLCLTACIRLKNSQR